MDTISEVKGDGWILVIHEHRWGRTARYVVEGFWVVPIMLTQTKGDDEKLGCVTLSYSGNGIDKDTNPLDALNVFSNALADAKRLFEEWAEKVVDKLAINQ